MRCVEKKGHWLKKLWAVPLGFIVAFCAFQWSCSSSSDPQEDLLTSSEWVGAADWDNATALTVVMKENADDSLAFDPADLTFTAGQPYIVTIQNPTGNLSKHYWTAAEFFQAVAWRKAQTVDAEYKAPYFKAFELVTGDTKSIDLYFIPVTTGTYEILCTIEGHVARGMTGTITVEGNENLSLDQEVAANWNSALDSDARTSGSNVVWDTALDVPVELKEISETEYAFDPSDLPLTQDTGYKLEIFSSDANLEKHYFTATEFYKTNVWRKAEDSQAEIKAPYLNAVELLVGGSTTLFIVPTVADTYDSICTIEGHSDLGMVGTVTVSP